MQKGYASVLVILLIALGIGGYFVYTKNNQPSSNTKQLSQNPTPKPSATTYLKRLFSKEKNFIANKSYPVEISEINESNLIGISCGQIYNKQPDDSYSYFLNNSVENPEIKVGETILEYISQAQSVSNKNISSVQICQVEDGGIIVILSEQLSGGGAGQNTYIALTDKEQVINKLAYIPSQPYAYFSCNQPLQFTKGKIFYIQCNAGDGLGGFSQIIEADLLNYKVRPIISCSSEGNVETKQVRVNCTP